jgi:glycosyltransferase involved in cell wall biosynthesis
MSSTMVSVVLPTYNRAELLRRAITSVLRQTHDQVELLVVDDCSTDETAQVVGSSPDPRVTYLRTESNSGQAAARNLGMEQAIGEWVAFLDDDDEWLPQHLSSALAAASRAPAAGVVYRPYYVSVDDRVLDHPIATPAGNVVRAMASGWVASLTSSLVVRRVHVLPGYDTTVVGVEDFDYWLSLALRTEFAVDPTPLVIVDKSPRLDRSNLGLARRLEAVDRLEQKWTSTMASLGLTAAFHRTCNQIRAASRLTAGAPSSPRERVALLRLAVGSRDVSRRVRLQGASRALLGQQVGSAVVRGWFKLRGVHRHALVPDGKQA